MYCKVVSLPRLPGRARERLPVKQVRHNKPGLLLTCKGGLGDHMPSLYASPFLLFQKIGPLPPWLVGPLILILQPNIDI